MFFAVVVVDVDHSGVELLIKAEELSGSGCPADDDEKDAVGVSSQKLNWKHLIEHFQKINLDWNEWQHTNRWETEDELGFEVIVNILSIIDDDDRDEEEDDHGFDSKINWLKAETTKEDKGRGEGMTKTNPLWV